MTSLLGEIIEHGRKREHCPAPRYCEDPCLFRFQHEDEQKIVYVRKARRGIWTVERFYCADCADRLHIRKHTHVYAGQYGGSQYTCYQCGRKF